ncbi:hypothetical protein F2Q69_00059337 [Brassica cretica]|uniref:Uncharacterized protein n=1 Tax=Brassica cretica TaxID=69181 RepID=A0A8S9RRN6_BRACR|nr:hypothetical protein F2Q69_00059337 [Brassica cretica]
MAFKPLLKLDVESDQISVFSLIFFVFQDVGGSCKGTDLPALYRRRGSYLSKGCTLSVSFLAIDSINGPDHTHSPMAVTRRPGTVKPLLYMSKTSLHGLPMLLAQSQEPTSPSSHTDPHGPATLTELVVQLLELTYTSVSYTELHYTSPSWPSLLTASPSCYALRLACFLYLLQSS